MLLKAYASILSKEEGAVKFSLLKEGCIINFVRSLLNKTPLIELYSGLSLSIFIETRLLHPLK